MAVLYNDERRCSLWICSSVLSIRAMGNSIFIVMGHLISFDLCRRNAHHMSMTRMTRQSHMMTGNGLSIPLSSLGRAVYFPMVRKLTERNFAQNLSVNG